jgi:hypothetical protein
MAGKMPVLSALAILTVITTGYAVSAAPPQGRLENTLTELERSSPPLQPADIAAALGISLEKPHLDDASVDSGNGEIFTYPAQLNAGG